MKQYASVLFPAPELIGLLMDLNVPKGGFRHVLEFMTSRRAAYTATTGLPFPRFVAWPLELGLGTLNARFVAWPLELGLGTLNPRFVACPLEFGLGTDDPRFVDWPLDLGLGTLNPRFVAGPLSWD